MFEQLKQLDAERGAKSMLVEMQQEIVSLHMPTAEIDIDTVADVGL